MNIVLVKNQEEVATFKKQRAETCNKLNEQQSTKKFMNEISGHFDEKVNQLQSDIAKMRMTHASPPL